MVSADFTVTLTAPKLGQLVLPRASSCGVLVVRSIGTPPELLESDPHLKIHWIEPGEFRALPLARDPDANKGTYGHALIVAGSLGKSGAAVLGGRGALRSGAGLVTVATPQDVLPVVAAGMPELMTEPLAATEAGTASLRNIDYGRFAEIARNKSVLAIGPGLSMQSETQEFIRALVAETELPVILDADGLNAYAGMADHLNQRQRSRDCAHASPGRNGAAARRHGEGCAGAAARSCARSGRAMARPRDFEGIPHDSRDALRTRLHQHHGESGDGDRGNRRRAHRHSRRADGAVWHRKTGRASSALGCTCMASRAILPRRASGKRR